jgi:hypothetical protein
MANGVDYPQTALHLPAISINVNEICMQMDQVVMSGRTMGEYMQMQMRVSTQISVANTMPTMPKTTSKFYHEDICSETYK